MRGSTETLPDREVGSGGIGHAAAQELTSVGGEVQSHMTRGSAGAHLS
jgi:hypothetical protein